MKEQGAKDERVKEEKICIKEFNKISQVETCVFHASVLGERERDCLQCLSESLDAVGMHALKRHRPLREVPGDGRLRRPATRNDEALLHQRAHHAQRVVHRAISLGQNELVRAAEQNSLRPPRVRHTGELHDLRMPRAAHGHLLNKLSRSQALRRKLVNVRHGGAAERAAAELDVVTFHL